MSNVIHFKPDRRSNTGGPGERKSATILFFTGVRYFRLSETDLVTAPMDGLAAEGAHQAGGQAVIERLQA